MQFNNFLKINIGAWVKRRGEYFIWEVVIVIILVAMLVSANIYALRKFDQASEVLNTTSEIMLTRTGIVIDNVDIESFQRAEMIITYKQKTVLLPKPLRNPFLFNAFLSGEPAKPTAGEKL